MAPLPFENTENTLSVYEIVYDFVFTFIFEIIVITVITIACLLVFSFQSKRYITETKKVNVTFCDMQPNILDLKNKPKKRGRPITNLNKRKKPSNSNK